MKKVKKKPTHKEARHGDCTFIVVSPEINHLKIAKGTRIYEISLH